MKCRFRDLKAFVLFLSPNSFESNRFRNKLDTWISLCQDFERSFIFQVKSSCFEGVKRRSPEKIDDSISMVGQIICKIWLVTFVKSFFCMRLKSFYPKQIFYENKLFSFELRANPFSTAVEKCVGENNWHWLHCLKWLARNSKANMFS